MIKRGIQQRNKEGICIIKAIGVNYEFVLCILNSFSFEMEQKKLIKVKMIGIHCLSYKNKTCQDIDNLDMMTRVQNMI